MEPESNNNPNYIIRNKNPDCIVCFEIYNSLDILPVLFNCGHSVCKNCYYKLDKNICPTCRKTIA